MATTTLTTNALGGYKQSGWGRELGTYGLDGYTEVKQINLNLDPQPTGWFQKR